MGRYIVTDEASQTVKVSRLTAALSSPCSPPAKKARFTSTPVKKCLFTADPCETDTNEVENAYACEADDFQDDAVEVDYSDNDNIGNLSAGILNMSIAEVTEDMANEIEELNDLVPKVLENLKIEDQEQVKTYMAFNRLVAEKSFPLTNIAYLLFLDIVKWFSTKTTSQMRYSDEVRRFWWVGLKLCKGNFLRFMSGMKNSGQQDIAGQTSYKASESYVNFAVPDRKILDKLESPVR